VKRTLPPALFLIAWLLPTAASAWLLTGTTVRFDNVTAVPGVRITLFPDSLVTVSDAQGDFLLTWSGERGYLTLVAREKNRDGSEWCKRLVLPARNKTRADSTYDVGPVIVMPDMALSGATAPTRANGVHPPRIQAPAPAPGERDSCDFWVRWTTDLWGHTREVAQVKGDTKPTQILEGVFDWIRNFPWTVARESRCGVEPPFAGRERFVYAWSDSGWTYVPHPLNYGLR
jgi:hypothetical protein